MRKDAEGVRLISGTKEVYEMKIYVAGEMMADGWQGPQGFVVDLTSYAYSSGPGPRLMILSLIQIRCC